MATPRTFAGTVDSASSAYSGVRAPATLTLVDHVAVYECRFVFVAGTPLTLTVLAPKAGENRIRGTADDPRGWKVAFDAELQGDRVTGTFEQPHDHGSFVLNAV